MNREHQPQPEYRDEQAARWQTADTYVAYLIEHAQNPDTASIIRDVYERLGNPFAAYLTLDGVNPYQASDSDPATRPGTSMDQAPPAAPDLEADFRNAFVARYGDRESLISDTISSFGWQRDLDHLLEGDPLLRAFVALDRNAIWDFIGDHFDVVQLDDEIFVFEQAP